MNLNVCFTLIGLIRYPAQLVLQKSCHISRYNLYNECINELCLTSVMGVQVMNRARVQMARI